MAISFKTGLRQELKVLDSHLAKKEFRHSVTSVALLPPILTLSFIPFTETALIFKMGAGLLCLSAITALVSLAIKLSNEMDSLKIKRSKLANISFTKRLLGHSEKDIRMQMQISNSPEMLSTQITNSKSFADDAPSPNKKRNNIPSLLQTLREKNSRKLAQ